MPKSQGHFPAFRLSAALFVGTGCTLWAGSVTLKPAADTTLFSFARENNCGKETTLVVGGINMGAAACRALLRFDLGTNVPAGAVITNVSLKLRVTKEKGTASAIQTQFHRLTKDWTEGTKTGKAGGAIGANGEATWKSRKKGVADWTGDGAEGDFNPAISATIAIDNTGAYTVNSTEALLTDVRTWLAAPTNNFGWILVAEQEAVQGSARRIASREDSSQAPTLTIGFTTPPPPPVLPVVAGTVSSDGQFELTFPAQTGIHYLVQSRSVFDSAPWSAAGTLTATNDGILTQRIPLAEGSTFFRILLQP
jgi:hypothetical protein